MRRLSSGVVLIGFLLCLQVQAQSEIDLEAEVEASQDLQMESPARIESAAEPARESPAEKAAEKTVEKTVEPTLDPLVEEKKPKSEGHRSLVEQELERQEEILKRKRRGEEQVSSDRNVNRFPKPQPLFKRPPGPPAGGSVRVDHPRAAEGLLRINKDGSYQYKTKIGEKSQSSSLKVTSMSPPSIGSDSTVSYKSMYGEANLLTVNFDYEWQPFRSFGSLGLQLGAGLTTATAKGTFRNSHYGRENKSEEAYNIFILPVSTFLIYRFEFVRRQWVVPFVTAGATYYGLIEARDDGKKPKLAGAPAAGAGGGLLFSISRLDSAGAFTLSQEYGVADMWLVLEAKAMQGLSKEIDFTNQSISGGIAVDF